MCVDVRVYACHVVQFDHHFDLIAKMKTDYNRLTFTQENSIKISRFNVKFIMQSVINRWLKMAIVKANEKRWFALDMLYCRVLALCVRAMTTMTTTISITTTFYQQLFNSINIEFRFLMGFPFFFFTIFTEGL